MGKRYGVAFPTVPRNGRGTCLVTAAQVAAAYTENRGNEVVPVFRPTRIISDAEGHSGSALTWRVVSVPDELVVLGSEDRLNLTSWKMAPEGTQVEVGDEVMAIGYDYFEGRPNFPYVTSGIVSHIGYRDESPIYIDFDAATDIGMVGGPVINRDLEVIGMIYAQKGPGKSRALAFEVIHGSLAYETLRC